MIESGAFLLQVSSVYFPLCSCFMLGPSQYGVKAEPQTNENYPMRQSYIYRSGIFENANFKQKSFVKADDEFTFFRQMHYTCICIAGQIPRLRSHIHSQIPQNHSNCLGGQCFVTRGYELTRTLPTISQNIFCKYTFEQSYLKKYLVSLFREVSSHKKVKSYTNHLVKKCRITTFSKFSK